MNTTVIILSFGKTFKIFIVILIFVGSSLLSIPRPQLALSSPSQTGLPTDWPSVFFFDGTHGSYNETFTGEVGDIITIALVVFNLTNTIIPDPQEGTVPLGNLDGFDVQISWNPTVLKYINHTLTVPVEDYPNPIPPSPYAGVLHEEAFQIMNVTDENAAIPNSEPGTMAWFAYTVMPGASVFNGDGTFFTMTFNVITRGSSPLKLTNLRLSGEGGFSPHVKCHQFDGLFHTADAPEADFTFWPDIGVVDKPVIFNASASCSPVNLSISKYIWDFGDETNATLGDPVASHSYVALQDYVVSLVVEDSNGTRSNLKTEQVSIVEKRNVKVVDVSLTPADLVLANRTVDIEVWLENDGRADENCTMKVYYNATAVNWTDISATNWKKIGETNVSIPKGKPSIEQLTWNTTGVPQVDTYYYVLANTTLVPYENDKDNNKTSRDPIFISSTALRDVAITKLEFGWRRAEGEAFKSPVLDGERTTFQITVLNAGTENETAVNVRLYCNNSMLRSWNQSIPYGNTIKLTSNELFDPGFYNLTALATTEIDVHPDNDRRQGTLHVIETPKLNFTFDPKTPYANQTVSFDASPSFHGESGASLTEYKWSIYNPRGTLVKTRSGSDLVNITYEFAHLEVWRVVLSVKDNYGIEYSIHRTATAAYQIGANIQVQPSAGFPIEYIIIIIIVAVAVVAALAIIYRRRRSKT